MSWIDRLEHHHQFSMFGSGTAKIFSAVSGMGRSFNVGLTLTY